MGKKEWLLLLLLSLLWGGTFFFNEIILQELPPFTLVMGRAALASAVLLILVYATGNRMPSSPAVWGSFLVMGILNNLIPHSLIAWGQQFIDSGLASILNATTPLFAVVFAHFLTREETLTLNSALGLLLGLAGVTVLIGPEALAGIVKQGVGQIAVLGAACSYALAGIYGRRFCGMPSNVTAAGTLGAAAVMMMPIVMLTGQIPNSWPNPSIWGAMLGLAFLSTALAYVIYFRVLATAGATNVLLVTFLIPLSALLLGVALLGEQVTWGLLLGMLLIFSGLVAVDGRLFKALTVQRSVTIDPNTVDASSRIRPPNGG